MNPRNVQQEKPAGEGGKIEVQKLMLSALRTILQSAAFGKVDTTQNPIILLTATNPAGHRPIHFATASDDPTLLQNMLEIFSYFPAPQYRLLVDARDHEGNTALHWSVMYGSVEAFLALIKAGATVGIANFEGHSPLHLAVINSEALPEHVCMTMITHLLHNGANPNIGDEDGATPLHLACGIGNASLIETLVEEGGASVNAVDHEGETALFYALRGQHVNVVRKLEELGVDINTRNSDGESALEFCKSCGDTEMVVLLESLQLKNEELPLLNPRSLSMELSESCVLSASSGWFGSHEVRSSF